MKSVCEPNELKKRKKEQNNKDYSNNNKKDNTKEEIEPFKVCFVFDGFIFLWTNCLHCKLTGDIQMIK